MILTEGILRARYRTSFVQPEFLEAGTVYELRLDRWATANVFLPGHRIRLEVTSSNFPRLFDRNSNRRTDHERNRRPVPTRGQPNRPQRGAPIAADPAIIERSPSRAFNGYWPTCLAKDAVRHE